MPEAPQRKENWRDSRHEATVAAHIHALGERRGVRLNARQDAYAKKNGKEIGIWAGERRSPFLTKVAAPLRQQPHEIVQNWRAAPATSLDGRKGNQIF